MALTKVSQAPQASATSAVGTPTVGSALDTSYGVSGLAVVTNGGTTPTIACDFVIEVSNDGGTTWFEWSRQTSNTGASVVTKFPFAIGLGSGADMGKYRTRFTGNTGQSVTVQADASVTTAIV